MTVALTGIIALCMMGCSSTRSVTRSSDYKFREARVESVVDSLRENISKNLNENLTEHEVVTWTLIGLPLTADGLQCHSADSGQTTVKVERVTDRTRVRQTSDVRSKKAERVIVRVDTVFVEKKDSVSTTTNFTNGTNKSSGFFQTLRWIFGILICVIVLVIFIKVKRLNCG